MKLTPVTPASSPDGTKALGLRYVHSVAGTAYGSDAAGVVMASARLHLAMKSNVYEKKT